MVGGMKKTTKCLRLVWAPADVQLGGKKYKTVVTGLLIKISA
jgi:hypothetical protein